MLILNFQGLGQRGQFLVREMLIILVRENMAMLNMEAMESRVSGKEVMAILHIEAM